MTSKQNLLILSIATILIATSTLFLSYKISKVYYKNYTFFYDPIGYMQDNNARYEKIKNVSRLQAVTDELKSNRNNPLTSVSLILFTPELLKSKWAHLLTTSIAFVLFILIFGICVFLRTSNLLFSISLTFLLCSIPLFTNPQWGLAVYWLDLQSALFMGAALFCFMNGVERISRKWLLLFSILLSFSILSRYIAVVFSLTIFVPLLLSYWLFFYKKWSKEELLKIIKYLSLSLLVILLLSGWFLISQYNATQQYYTGDSLYQIELTFLNSSTFFFKTCGLFYSYPQYIFFLLLLTVSLYFNIKKQSIYSTLILLCLLFSLPIYVIFIKKIVIGSHALMFAIPPFVAACLVFPLNNVISKKIFTIISISVLLFSSLFMYRSIKNNYWLASSPPNFKKDEKELNTTLCKYFNMSNKSKPVWQGFFDTYQAIPAVEYFYTTGKTVLSPSYPLFNVELGYWKRDYPNMNELQVLDEVKNKVEAEVDILVVLKDTTELANRKWVLNNSYSKTICNQMAVYAGQNSLWKEVGEIPTQKYDTLIVYFKNN